MNTQKNAIFPGSFDLLHEGHIDIIERAICDFDIIYLVISWSEKKTRRFSFKLSYDYAKQKLSKYNNVFVFINDKYMTTEIMDELNCFNLIRGYRNDEDLLYENQLKNIYLSQNPKTKIKYYKTNSRNKNISSTKNHL